jgi:hypothetical protein
MNKIIFSITLLILSITKAYSFDPSLISEGEMKRLELIADQFHQGQSAIWPTLDWKDSPLIVVFESGRYYAFHLQSQDSEWKTLHIKGMEVQAASHDKWGLNGLHMQAWFEIEGKQAFVYRMGEVSNPREDVMILAHERFHRHQGEHFVMNQRQGQSQDHLVEDNLAWSAIEDLLLRDFLQAKTGEKLELIKDFIAVNQMRRDALDEDTLIWENGQLRMEGLADYVSTKAFGGEKALLSVHPYDEDQDEFIDDIIKWRHYLAGAAIGYALDFLKALQWKEKVESGENLADLLAKQVPLSKDERKTRLINIQKRMNYKKRKKIASSKVESYLKLLEDIESDYLKMEGLPLFVAHPRLSISGGGSNEKMVHLMEGGTVGLNDASVATTSDGSWKFQTRNVSHLYMHVDGVREVKMQGNPDIKVDQVSLKMAEVPQEYLFHSIEIEAENLSFSSNKHLGVLIADERGVGVSLIQ